MQFDLTSDLHLDMGGFELLANAPSLGTEVLVIAGDTVEVATLKSSSKNKKIIQYLHTLNDRYKLIVMVLGNHEYWRNSFQHTVSNLRAILAKHKLTNFVVLEKQTLEYQDVIFFGATMWTTFRNRNPLAMRTAATWMKDYTKIHIGDKHLCTKLIPEDTARQCEITKEKIKEFVALNTDKKKVLITHMAPSSQSLDKSYPREVDDAYYEELFDIIVDSDIKVACHGHIHFPTRYQIGDCTVVSNPRGYVGYELQAMNHKFLKIDV